MIARSFFSFLINRNLETDRSDLYSVILFIYLSFVDRKDDAHQPDPTPPPQGNLLGEALKLIILS